MTFFEIAELSEGQRLLALSADGVRDSEQARLNELAEKLG